ncbi:unnamed protein product [Chondrus crispus]|uniref:Uncharacterized protein n=1 Tax=Chondrus crispus TaxID=2769 RepID=R7Q4S0_CHOCR|nr:unnamed protein product [Chondrus crispus]CDF32376.1 unnamed protein product [Chondrus crispus]|eukprot:XP_005712041.1 unnamed protein product [Chondrus crispus]
MLLPRQFKIPRSTSMNEQPQCNLKKKLLYKQRRNKLNWVRAGPETFHSLEISSYFLVTHYDG